MVADMKTITLKNIPQPIHAALKRRAKEHGRSLNNEVLACLERVVSPTRVNIKELLRDIQKHRATLPGKLSEQLIQMATAKDRP